MDKLLPKAPPSLDSSVSSGTSWFKGKGKQLVAGSDERERQLVRVLTGEEELAALQTPKVRFASSLHSTMDTDSREFSSLGHQGPASICCCLCSSLCYPRPRRGGITIMPSFYLCTSKSSRRWRSEEKLPLSSDQVITWMWRARGDGRLCSRVVDGRGRVKRQERGLWPLGRIRKKLFPSSVSDHGPLSLSDHPVARRMIGEYHVL